VINRYPIPKSVPCSYFPVVLGRTVHLSMARRQLECFADKNSKEAARAIGSTDADLGLILNHLLKQEIHTQAEA
jgi:predicted metal-dependent hydrolase